MRNFLQVTGIVLSISCQSHAAESIDLKEMHNEVIWTMDKAKEALDTAPAPRYMLYRAIIQYSIEQSISGEFLGRIPIFISRAEATASAGVTKTGHKVFVYEPAQVVVPRSYESKGLSEHIEFLVSLAANAAKTPFLLKRMEYSEDFALIKQGKIALKLLSSVEISGMGNLNNKHSARYFFCLTEDGVTCVPATED